MQINPRQSRVGPPSFRKPASTARAEEHLQKARDIQAFTSVSAQMLDLTDKMIEADAQDQYATAITKAARGMDDIKLKYEKDPDYATHLERYEQDINNTKSDILETVQNERAKKYFNQWWDAHEETYRFGIIRNAMIAKANHMRYQLDVNLAEAVKVDNSEGQAEIAVKSLIAGAYAAGHLKPEDKERLLSESLHAIDVNEISKQIQGIMYTEGLEEARAYLYSDATNGFTVDDIENVAKVLDEYETKVVNKEVERIADLFYNDDGNINVTHEMIDQSKLSNQGKFSKTYWHQELNKELEKKHKEKREEAETAEYKQVFDTAFNEVEEIDLSDPKNTNAFNALLEKTILKDGDKDDLRRIANANQKAYDVEQKELEETAKEEQERLRDKDFSRAYEAIKMTGEITDKQQYRDKAEYPHLDEKEDWPKLDKVLEDKQKPEVQRSNLDTLSWLSQHHDNADIDNKAFEDYVIRNRENLAGNKYGDYKTWLNRARTRDVTKTDPAKKPAITIIIEAFKDFDKLAEGLSMKTAFQKEKPLVIEDYTKWLENNLDADYIVKIQKAEEMVNGFRKDKMPEILDELIERREVRAGTLGLDEYIEHVGSPPVQTGKDKEGNLTFSDGKTGYRFNAERDRLEYYDVDKGKWRKAK